MKSTNQNTLNAKDKILFVAMLIVTALATYLFYYSNFSAPIMALIWIGWFIIIATFGFFTSQGKTILEFASESKAELLKIVWPTRAETVQTTSIVMIMVAVTGFVLWGLDSGMMWIIGKLTHLG